MEDTEEETGINPEERFRLYFCGEFSPPPASPWACNACGRGYAIQPADGRCWSCKNGRVKRVPYVEEPEP